MSIGYELSVEGMYCSTHVTAYKLGKCCNFPTQSKTFCVPPWLDLLKLATFIQNTAILHLAMGKAEFPVMMSLNSVQESKHSHHQEQENKASLWRQFFAACAGIKQF